jgi:hypothetical protein
MLRFSIAKYKNQFISEYYQSKSKIKSHGKMTRTGDGKWTEEKASKHKNEMFDLLNK